MTVRPMPSRLLLAVALSLALHTGVLLWDARSKLSLPPAPPPLEATLYLPAKPAAHDDEPLLKNTLIHDPAPVKAVPPPPPAAHAAPPTAKAMARRQIEAAQRKLSQRVYYPPEALARGLEGEVCLILILADDGSITDVSIAISSGHAILDQAAVKEAYARGRMKGTYSHEWPFCVTYKLVE